MLVIAIAFPETAAAAEQFDPAICKSVKEAVELFLAIAVSDFKKAEKLRLNDDATVAEAKLEEAASMSDLMADYSTVYATFC